jgi:hypothetical protein
MSKFIVEQQKQNLVCCFWGIFRAGAGAISEASADFEQSAA